MLPSVFSKMPRLALKGVVVAATALALALPAAPAQALGRNERNVLKGVAGALLLGAIIKDAQAQGHRPRRAQPQPYQPPYQEPYSQPLPHHPYPQPGYQGGYQGGYQPVYPQEPRPQRRHIQHSIHATATAQAFGAYRPQERRRIQQALAMQGYYRGGIDGAFGPGTYNAILAYANDRGESARLASVAGVHQVMGRLLY